VHRRRIVRQHLEILANLELLQRRHFTRTHACGKCGSARLLIYEACPECGSADLAEELLVHHYRCGCQEAESHFIQGNLLICPKCRRELNHLGVDYGKPGKIVVCRACGAANSEPDSRFVCMDCNTMTPAEIAATTDWYHYDLTEPGLNCLHTGQLPQFDFDPSLEKFPRAYSPREFHLLAAQEARAARRYRRAFSIARISFPNLGAIRHELGMLAADAAFQRAVDEIVQTVRATADVRPIEDRIRQALHDTIETPVEVAIEVAENDAAVAMLARG
jgi:Thaumarchaeal output domain 1